MQVQVNQPDVLSTNILLARKTFVIMEPWLEVVGLVLHLSGDGS